MQPDQNPSATGSILAVAALADTLRQRMYWFIRGSRRPVTRDEAAASVGISRKLAAHHLDKLVGVGLLRAHYEPVGGVRRVGRTPKVYEPTGRDLQISIPSRHHEVLADVLIEAILTEDAAETARQAAQRVARERGRQLGVTERRHVRAGRLGAERALTLAADALQQCGFEPERVRPDSVRLRNCPFHPLAAKAPELVCEINHAYINGLIDGLDAATVAAVLSPRSGECCVELNSTPTRP